MSQIVTFTFLRKNQRECGGKLILNTFNEFTLSRRINYSAWNSNLISEFNSEFQFYWVQIWESEHSQVNTLKRGLCRQLQLICDHHAHYHLESVMIGGQPSRPGCRCLPKTTCQDSARQVAGVGEASTFTTSRGRSGQVRASCCWSTRTPAATYPRRVGGDLGGWAQRGCRGVGRR